MSAFAAIRAAPKIPNRRAFVALGSGEGGFADYIRLISEVKRKTRSRDIPRGHAESWRTWRRITTDEETCLGI